MANIDVVTTATLRPTVLDETYKSFTQKFLSHRHTYNLIINVDPIGDKSVSQIDVLQVAKKYFNNVTYNFPKEPHFTKAVKWLWSNSSSDFVFHLEDDWKLLDEITTIDEMIDVMQRYPKIGHIQFYKGHLFFDMAAYFYHTYKQIQDRKLFLQILYVQLSPSLYRGEFVRSISKEMFDDLNPEYQLVEWGRKNTEIIKAVNEWDKILWTKNWLLPLWKVRVKSVTDIGRGWRTQCGYHKEPRETFWKYIGK